MRVATLTTHYMESHSYLLIENGHAVIIDPGDADLLSEYIEKEQLAVDFGILTHEHCDHTAACSEIQQKYQCKMISSYACDVNMKDQRKNLSRYYAGLIAVQGRLKHEEQKEIMPYSAKADLMFKDELMIRWQGHSIECHETPGHSEGSICILIDEEWMFSGDTLMWGEKTNTRFKGGSEAAYRDITLPWLLTLNGELKVFAGHNESFILKDRLQSPIL